MAKRRSRSRAQVEKRAPQAVAPQATFTAQQMVALTQALTASTGQAQPLPRLDPAVAFGPGVPLMPSALDPIRDGAQRPEPRIYEYPVSLNLPGMTDRLVPWQVLRNASEIPVVRDCIRIRKNEITTLEWDIVPTKRALQQYRSDSPDTSSVEIKRELRRKLNPEIARLTEFWEKPDWQQDESFVEWATKLLEEHLVLDALAIYPFRDRAGQRQGLRILDGSTIKPLLDHLGGKPMPPSPAYQQVLWGFPRGEFVADLDGDGVVPNAYSSDRLIYKRREVRTITPYGFSAVEQSIQDVDLYLRRLEWQKGVYTDGVEPAGWILNEGHENWTPQQLMAYNRAFNDEYAGNTLQRMRFHLLPPGMKPQTSAEIGEKYKPDYDLHLIKLVCMHFDVTLAELGFTEAKGLGSAGWHEGQENVQQRKATNPTLKWLQSVITEISRSHLGMPSELEFRFLGLEAEEQAAADEVTTNQLKTGRITWNEAREEMGRAPYAFPEADMPALLTTKGFVFLNGASQLAAPGEEVTTPKPPSESAGEAEPDEQDDEESTEPNEEPSDEGDASNEAKTELAAYRKWLANGHTTSRRPFLFKHLSPAQAQAAGVDFERVAFTAKASDPGPKVEGRSWPAWQKDQAVAAHWAWELRQALSGVPTKPIAARWLEVRKASEPDQHDRRAGAIQWLTSLGARFAKRIAKVLGGLYIDAYLVGDTAARAVLDDTGVDWADWEPGDTANTRLLIGSAGGELGLQQLLAQADEVAAGIEATRIRGMAEILTDAVDEQPTVDELDARLSEYLDDEAGALLVAVTEVSRGGNLAALARYDTRRLAGITHVEWAVDPERPCPVCVENADAGPVPIGTPFPSGLLNPPQHPRCRCAVWPSLS